MKQNSTLDFYSNNSKLIKAEAAKLGFSGCGISESCILKDESVKLKQWIEKGFHADMGYMSVNTDKRSDPRLLSGNARSIVSVILNYFPKVFQSPGLPMISKYAYGKDYHFVLKSKLNLLLKFINENIRKTEGKAFVDTAPVFEKAWAARAGLGWMGKNSCLITKEFGSWVFIGELILDIELEYDIPIKNYCGSCTKCIDACPTNAIVSANIIDSNKCISYNTIENKALIPESLKGKMNNYIFGCDICQNVCPWNKSPVPTVDKELNAVNPLLEMTSGQIKTLEDAQLKKMIKGTALERAKVKGLIRNLDFISG